MREREEKEEEEERREKVKVQVEAHKQEVLFQAGAAVAQACVLAEAAAGSRDTERTLPSKTLASGQSPDAWPLCVFWAPYSRWEQVPGSESGATAQVEERDSEPGEGGPGQGPAGLYQPVRIAACFHSCILLILQQRTGLRGHGPQILAYLASPCCRS